MIEITMRFNDSDYSPEEGPQDRDGVLANAHELKFQLRGDEINGPGFSQLNKRFFKIAAMIQEELKKDEK